MAAAVIGTVAAAGLALPAGAAASFRLIGNNPVVVPTEDVKVRVEVQGETSCVLRGPRLGPRVADARTATMIQFHWVVPERTRTGRYKITVTCGAQTATRYIRVRCIKREGVRIRCNKRSPARLGPAQISVGYLFAGLPPDDHPIRTPNPND